MWPCGDPSALCEALRSAAALVDPATRAAVRAHFERELSFDSLGAKLAAMYRDAVERARLHRGLEAVVTAGAAVGTS